MALEQVAWPAYKEGGWQKQNTQTHSRKHRLVQSPWLPHRNPDAPTHTRTHTHTHTHTHSRTHTKKYSVSPCFFSVSLLSCDLWFSIQHSHHLIMNAGKPLTICCVLSPGSSGSCWAKGGAWPTWPAGKSTTPWLQNQSYSVLSTLSKVFYFMELSICQQGSYWTVSLFLIRFRHFIHCFLTSCMCAFLTGY